MTENHPHFSYSSTGPQTGSSYGSPNVPTGTTTTASTTPQSSVQVAEPQVGIDTSKAQQVYQVARALYDQGCDWVTFFREVLGLHGAVRTTFTTPEAMAAFEQSEQFEKIQHMLAKLRERSQAKQNPANFEPTRVITVRLPKSLHESLRAEAHEKRTSMNKLCISKLLQFIDGDLVPTET